MYPEMQQAVKWLLLKNTIELRQLVKATDKWQQETRETTKSRFAELTKQQKALAMTLKKGSIDDHLTKEAIRNWLNRIEKKELSPTFKSRFEMLEKAIEK